MTTSEEISIPDDGGIVVKPDDGDNADIFIEELDEVEEVVTTSMGEE